MEQVVKTILFQFVVLVLQDTNAHQRVVRQHLATLVNIKTNSVKQLALPVHLPLYARTEMHFLSHAQQGIQLTHLKQPAFLHLQHPVLQQRTTLNSHGLILESASNVLRALNAKALSVLHVNVFLAITVLQEPNTVQDVKQEAPVQANMEVKK